MKTTLILIATLALAGCSRQAEPIGTDAVPESRPASVDNPDAPSTRNVAPTFSIDTGYNARAKAEGRKVESRIEENLVIFDCLGEAGEVRVKLTNGHWPPVVLVRIHRYEYIDGFSAKADGVSINWVTRGPKYFGDKKCVQVALPASELYLKQPRVLTFKWVARYR